MCAGKIWGIILDNLWKQICTHFKVKPAAGKRGCKRDRRRSKLKMVCIRERESLRQVVRYLFCFKCGPHMAAATCACYVNKWCCHHVRAQSSAHSLPPHVGSSTPLDPLYLPLPPSPQASPLLTRGRSRVLVAYPSSVWAGWG